MAPVFEPVIGLEIHLALRTRTKLFCSCSADTFGAPPNTHVCPVCLGLPGSLPVVNREAVDQAVMFSLALGCTVAEDTQFHRKNYFYPDAPKNYQTSQYDRPIGSGGAVLLEGGRWIGVTRCHLEEDAGRLAHPPYAAYSLADYNRAGTPLIEMVSEPDIRGPEEARAYLTAVRAIAQALGVSDASPEEGKMRADVNVSLRRPGGPLGTKVEIKNLNSFKSVERALQYEIKRQSRLLAEGGAVRQDTLGWDDGGQKTYLLRSKEGEADYRYFPDPDLPPLHIDKDWQERVRARSPELPAAKRQRYLAAGVRPSDAAFIAYDVSLAAFFDRSLALSSEPQALANWLCGDVSGWLNTRGLALDASRLTPEHLAALVGLVSGGSISGKTAKDLLPEVMEGANPEELVRARGLEQITDESALERIVDEVVAQNPDIARQVAQNPKAVNALLGKVMKETRGQASPELVRALLERKLTPT